MTKKKQGPDADRLKIDADWEDAVADALEKPRPKDGWPEPGDDSEKSDSGHDKEDQD